MNDFAKKFLTRTTAYFSGLSPKARTTYAIGAAVALVSFLGLSVWMNRDPLQVLFSDVQREDSRAIAKSLGEQNIPHEFRDDGATVLVPQSKVAAARMQLAKEGIPGQDVVGFEKFDGSTLGMSSYVQRIQYIRAVQGELTRSIQRLAAVKRARVHISVPPKKVFLEEEEPPKGSVVLELHRGQMPSKAEIQGVAHLVASAVEGLKVSNVTIVDTKGNFLHRPEESTGPVLSTALLDMQRSIENEYEKRVNEILTPVVGYGKVRAKVTVEIDPSRTNTTEETFDADRSAVRSSIRNEETSNGSRPNPVGIPGSRSNLPGAEAQTPPVPTSNTNTEKNVQNTTYAIPRKIQIVDKPSGNIKRLTVAVVVDGLYNKSDNGEVFSPRSDDELKRLQQLVENSIGFDSSRRDSVTVSSLPFRTEDLGVAVPEENIPWWKTKEVRDYAIRNLFIVLSGIAIFFLAFRWILGSKAAALGTNEEAGVYPKTVAELEAARNSEALAALAGGTAAPAVTDAGSLDKREEFELKKQVLELFDQTPRKGIRVVQDWLEEDRSLTPASNPEPAAARVG